MKLHNDFAQVGIHDAELGSSVKIVEPVNIYGCKIGSNCFIGPFVEIQKGVVIGNNCKVQSHAFICELVEIGENCVISHGAKFTNDLFSDGSPAMGDKNKWQSTKLGNRVLVGTNATLLPVTICDDVVIGAGAVVTKDISKPGIYAGNPARFLRAHSK